MSPSHEKLSIVLSLALTTALLRAQQPAKPSPSSSKPPASKSSAPDSATPPAVADQSATPPDEGQLIHGTDHEDKLGAAASHGCIRMSQADVYELGRLLQERAGASRQPQWYARVINGGQSASVLLPKAVPIVIGW